MRDLRGFLLLVSVIPEPLVEFVVELELLLFCCSFEEFFDNLPWAGSSFAVLFGLSSELVPPAEAAAAAAAAAFLCSAADFFLFAGVLVWPPVELVPPFCCCSSLRLFDWPLSVMKCCL